MSRKIIVVSTVCFCMTAFLSALAGDKSPIRWSFGSTTSDSHPSVRSIEKFAKAISDATAGRWTVDVYANSTIGNEPECIDMVRTGTLTMCATNLTTMEQFIPDFGVFALPYLFRSWDDFNDYLLNRPLAKQLLGQLEKSANLKLTTLLLNGTRCLSTNKIPPIQRPADLKGVKIRSMEQQVWQDIIAALGGTAIPVNFSELYMALQTGVVNGQDNPIVLLYSNKFHEVLDNVYRTDHCYNTATYWINPAAYAALDDEDRVLFERLNQEHLVDYYNSLMADYNREAEDGLKRNKVRLWETDEFDIKAFYAASDNMINQKYLGNPVFRPYIEAIRETYNY